MVTTYTQQSQLNPTERRVQQCTNDNDNDDDDDEIVLQAMVRIGRMRLMDDQGK